ncbi:MAG: autotransporter-associated beta strand repeat-containing protein, partial [Verrucomicrobiaceae bacterium]|nr:autotransporter-associated beta strand repeat-containing protein [Verrucomicrobiaceae bacterium]
MSGTLHFETRIGLYAAVLVLSLLLPVRLRAQTWNNPGTGDWTQAANWTGGLPSSGTNATISNGGTATLAGIGAAANLFIGSANTGTLSIVTGGSLSVASTTLIGSGSGTGFANISGGTWDTAGDFFTGYFRPGSLGVTGGAVTVGGNSYVAYSSNSGATISNGTWTTSGALYVGVDAGLGGAGILSINGGTVTALTVPLATDLGSTGTVNLNGGVLATTQILESNGAGGGFLNFNGGTLRATASAASLLDSFETGDVQLLAGGGTIDTNGFAAGISTALQGAGGLTKQGAGRLTLSGSSTYAGTTLVSAGTLNVTGSISGGDDITVQPAATLSGTGNISASAGNYLYLNGNLVVGDTSLGSPVSTVLDIGTSGGGSAVLGVGSTLTFDLFTRGGNLTGNISAADRIRLFGLLDGTTGGLLSLTNPNNLTGFANGDSWRLFDLTSGPGSISGNLSINV